MKPILFLFSPSRRPPSLLPLSDPHIDKQPVKVKRKKSFNLTRKFPFYKSKENIVQELVESEREYPRCVMEGGAGWCCGFFFFLVLSPSCFSSVSQLSSFRSPPRDGLCDGTTLIPFSHCPGEMPHTHTHTHRAVWGEGGLSGVSASVYGLQRSVCCQPGVCECVAALTHRPSQHGHAAPCISPDQSCSQSLTHNKRNLINWTEALTLNRSKSHFNGIGPV